MIRPKSRLLCPSLMLQLQAAFLSSQDLVAPHPHIPGTPSAPGKYPSLPLGPSTKPPFSPMSPEFVQLYSTFCEQNWELSSRALIWSGFTLYLISPSFWMPLVGLMMVIPTCSYVCTSQ